MIPTNSESKSPLLARLFTLTPRRNRKVLLLFCKEQYKERHLVECFFQKLKRYRRIATRYDKLAKSFLAFVHLACLLIWFL